MDRIASYREIIKRLLRERERIVQPVLPEELEVRCFFDDERGQYALITLGWMKRKRISGNTLFLTLRGQQIWIEDDMTDAPNTKPSDKVGGSESGGKTNRCFSIRKSWLRLPTRVTFLYPKTLCP